MSIVLPAIIFFLVIVAAVVIVGSWLLFSFVRGVKRLVGGPAAPAGAQTGPRVAGGECCPRAACRADNPAHAQFCRKCGEPLPARSSARRMRVA